MTDRLSLRQTSVTCPRLQSDHSKANEVAAPLHTVVLQHFLWVMVWSSEYDSELVLSWGNEARKSCFVCGVPAETSAEMWNTTSGGFMLLHTNRDIFCWDTDRGPQSPADITDYWQAFCTHAARSPGFRLLPSQHVSISSPCTFNFLGWEGRPA